MDKFSKAKRSEIMAAIRGKDTLPEKIVRSFLFRKGFRFRVCDKRLPGKPDIVLPRWKTVIEVRGCFWHRHDCAESTRPKTNREFWSRKFRANVARDRRNEKALTAFGWDVIVVWTCGLSPARRDKTLAEVLRLLRGSFQGARHH